MARKSSADKQHRWLSQIEVTGVVFSEPVLAEAAPTGFPSLDRQVLAQFHKAREIWNLPKGMISDDGYRGWIGFILEEILRLRNPSDWLIGAAIPTEFAVNLASLQETLRPSRVLVDNGEPLMFLLEVPRSQSLDKPWVCQNGRWKASPTTKLERLLRETGVELGFVTNGDSWRLVVASPSETAAWCTWTTATWADSPLTLAAFRDLFGEERFFAGERENVVLELIRRSRKRQLDVADQLGKQVREALVLLVQALDRADVNSRGALLRESSETQVFEASVALIMRLLFLLFAEENGLLPHGNVHYDSSYGVLHLLNELEHRHRLSPEKLKQSYSAYARVLATSRLVYSGCLDPDIRVAAHGGGLFDPDRFPALEGRSKEEARWLLDPTGPPLISDATIRQILRALKYAKTDGSRQLVSYRALAVEQIGHMYEGLLDRKVVRAPEKDALILLQGSAKEPDPEPLLSSEIASLSNTELMKVVCKRCGRKKTSLNKFHNHEKLAEVLKEGGAGSELVDALLEVLPLVRDRGIVRAGGLYVTNGQDRRSQGAHYTPSTLTEPIVRRTLEHQVYVNVHDKPGLLVDPKRVKTPREILDLKVCDPAMGSGAFLVQVVRYLGERLVDSWELAVQKDPDLVLAMPYASPSEASEGEALLPESREERLVWAKRYVAEHCIYGVDLNPHAVEMAKLSLWLATASKDRPFTFLDHSLKHGDSLIGLTNDQIEKFTWNQITTDWGPLFINVADSFGAASSKRIGLYSLSEHLQAEKRQFLTDANASIVQSKLVGDLCLAAFFGEKSTKARETRREELKTKIEFSKRGNGYESELRGVGGELREKLAPFHWELEFPEVFKRDNPGFDSFVGNPPFLGGRRISTVRGASYFAFLCTVNRGAKNLCDLVAHFLRSSYARLRRDGTMGMLATNTVAQGDTRTGGLSYICQYAGGTIYRAQRRYKWPGASVVVSVLHIAKGPYNEKYILDDVEVERITAFLFHSGGDKDPSVLNGCNYLFSSGSKIYGQGFLFDDRDSLATSLSEMEELIRKYPEEAVRIQPYIGGSELNQSPSLSHHRYVINFSDIQTEKELRNWPNLEEIVRRKVKPERDKLPPGASNKPLKKRWWGYQAHRPQLYSGMKDLSRVLACSQVAPHFTFAFLTTNFVFSQSLVVFLLPEIEQFALLQSRVHEIWSRFMGSTAMELPRYTPTDCFETFAIPFESWDFRDSNLAKAGKRYYSYRANLMLENDEGLTDIYNRFHDPRETSPPIEMLRDLHSDVDQAALRAYGWTDIPTQCGFFLEYEIDETTWSPKKRKPYRYHWSDGVRDEILARLLELNQKRSQDKVK